MWCQQKKQEDGQTITIRIVLSLVQTEQWVSPVTDGLWRMGKHLNMDNGNLELEQSKLDKRRQSSKELCSKCRT